jgi:hypothetical protein
MNVISMRINLYYGNVSISQAIVLNYMIIHKRRIVKVRCCGPTEVLLRHLQEERKEIIKQTSATVVTSQQRTEPGIT